jgi:outer membrane protein assembly factor BamA
MASVRTRLSFSLLIPLLAMLPALGKPLATSLGKIKEIRMTGLKRYSPAEVLPVSGLTIGQSITEDDLKEATNVLARTGAFSNLAYSYSTLAGSVKVTLDLQETDQLLAIRLDNFVWWTEDDVKAKLRARVPLYRDQLPVAGSLPDAVADGLQALLSERQLPGHVTYTRFAPEGQPLEAFVYHVEDISVRIRSVDFPGAGADEIPALQEAARKQLIGKQYSAAQVVIVAGVDFRDVYQRRGYLQAQFGAPVPTAPDAVKPNPAPTDGAASTEDAPDANIVRVDVHLPVQPGLQFHLLSVDWTGNQAISTAALQKFVAVAPGEIADLPKLREGLDAVTKMYGNRGYMKVQHSLVPHLDLTAKTASFTIKIVEGDVYRFGELTIEGVDSKTAARLRDHWSLRPGEPFDTSYEMTFMKETQNLLPQGRWSSADAHLDESDKTVDVVLRYSPTSIN